MSPGADELRDLARKYRTLVALRARRDQEHLTPSHEPPLLSEPRTPAAVLRSLAREFPGCLRELDTLGAAELARRAACVAEAAAAGAASEPWIAWIAGYHRLMRAALAIRRSRDASAREVGERFGRDGHVDRDGDVDAAFVAEVMAPPHGRLGIVVLRRLAREFGVPAREIAAALFPLRRPSPYEL